MKSKSLILLTALAVLVSIRYATDAWVQPALSGHSPEVSGGMMEIAFTGLNTAFSGLQFGLGLATLSCVILLARSAADALAARGWIRF